MMWQYESMMSKLPGESEIGRVSHSIRIDETQVKSQSDSCAK